MYWDGQILYLSLSDYHLASLSFRLLFDLRKEKENQKEKKNAYLWGVLAKLALICSSSRYARYLVLKHVFVVIFIIIFFIFTVS